MNVKERLLVIKMQEKKKKNPKLFDEIKVEVNIKNNLKKTYI